MIKDGLERERGRDISREREGRREREGEKRQTHKIHSKMNISHFSIQHVTEH